MRSLLFVGALLLVLFQVQSADPTESLEGVLDLTPDTFDKYVNGGKHALVEFYAPWCGHCKSLTPEYKKLGKAILSDPVLKSQVVIAKVNADEHKSLGEKFEVRGFPTIKFFPRGKPATKDSVLNYDSARTADKFLEYIQAKVAADKSFARVEILDTIASEFVKTDDKDAVLKDAKEKLDSLSGDDKANGELYIKFMEKAQEKGLDYFVKEKARLSKMISTGNVHASKLDELSRKTSVLSAFLPEEETNEE